MTPEDRQILDRMASGAARQILPAGRRAVRAAQREIAEVERLRDALRIAADYMGVGRSKTEHFDHLADAFYRDTGVVAPGRDQAPVACFVRTREEREHRWQEWLATKRVEARDAIAAALNSPHPQAATNAGAGRAE